MLFYCFFSFEKRPSSLGDFLTSEEKSMFQGGSWVRLALIPTVTTNLNPAMKAVSTSIYARGKGSIYYFRKRIPADLLDAYDGRLECAVSLKTKNLSIAQHRASIELKRLTAEFARKRSELDLGKASLISRYVGSLTNEQVRLIGQHWKRVTLSEDDTKRQQELGNEEFDLLGQQLEEKQRAWRRMLAQGRAISILPEVQAYLLDCGLKYVPSEEEAKVSCYTFLKYMVETINLQMQRQSGGTVDTDAAAPKVWHPLQVVFPETAPRDPNAPTWEKVFQIWHDDVIGRRESTTTSYKTPWRELQRVAADFRLISPSDITKSHIQEVVVRMENRGLDTETVLSRVQKLRRIFQTAIQYDLLTTNPANDVACRTRDPMSTIEIRRLPFSEDELQTIFRSPIYTKQTRSRGQSGEASYWIPLLMHFTGARPEELAGLALDDMLHSPHGWMLRILNRPVLADQKLFDDDEVPKSHRRKLKGRPSVRDIPVATELIDLGLLRYVRWLRAQGHTMFFPTLKKDANDKLSSGFTKFFGRYKKAIGIVDPNKVLYSFRHNMKDYLEKALIPSKYVKRILGHVTGDGKVTDKYGSDLPFKHIARFFATVEFPNLHIEPWEPGTTKFRRKRAKETQCITATERFGADGLVTDAETLVSRFDKYNRSSSHLRLVSPQT
jgi:integrase